MIDFHPIKNWKIRKELKAEEKEKALAQRIVNSMWFQREINELKSDLFGDASSQVEAGRLYVAEATNALLENGNKLNDKYENLASEVKKAQKQSGDAVLETKKIKELQKSFDGLMHKYEALDAQYKLLKKYIENTDGQIGALTEIIKSNSESAEEKIKKLTKAVSRLSRMKEADNEIAIGGIKIKDLHTAEDVVRAMVAMDKKVSGIEGKVDAVYNVNRGAGRLSAVKKVKPTGERVIQ